MGFLYKQILTTHRESILPQKYNRTGILLWHLTGNAPELIRINAHFGLQVTSLQLTETEGNSMFCGPETVDHSRGETEGNIDSRESHKDFTNAQAFFVSACKQATSWKIKLVN